MGNETHTIEIPYNDTLIPAQVLKFNVVASTGSLTVTAARLIYKKYEHSIWEDMNNKAFLPAGVIDARYE